MSEPTLLTEQELAEVSATISVLSTKAPAQPQLMGLLRAYEALVAEREDEALTQKLAAEQMAHLETNEHYTALQLRFDRDALVCTAACKEVLQLRGALATEKARADENYHCASLLESRLAAAEAALASARTLLAEVWGQYKEDCGVSNPEVEAFLSSTPTPVAAPLQLTPVPGLGAGYYECEVPVAAPHPHPHEAEHLPWVHKALVGAGLTAPVAAPCAGCAELETEMARMNAHILERDADVKAYKQAIDAAVVELEQPNTPNPATLVACKARALSALRAARGSKP